MKKKLIFALIGLLLAIGCGYDPGAHNGPAQKLVPDPRAEKMWGSDLAAAQARAKTSGKLVFIDFTGSDWCPPCMALHDNVLTQTEFLDYADKNLELVEIDFPRNKPLNVPLNWPTRTSPRNTRCKVFPHSW